MGKGVNDQEVYSNSGFDGRMGFGRKPAIVVVDFSIGFTDPAVAVGTSMLKEMEQTKRMLDVLREKELPIVFVTISYNKNMADAGAWKMKWLSSYDFCNPELTEINPLLEYNPEKESLIAKKGASSFFETNLTSLLVSQGVDTVIITGCVTSGCVRATAVDACQSGFRTIVVSDASADRAQAPHDASLFDIQNKYGDVYKTDEVLEELKKY